MADQAERVILEAEDQVTPIVGKANAALGSFENKAESSHGKVIRISDQTRSSVQRLIASLEKQADVYGKSGVEKLVAQRDQLLQRYGREPVAVDAITKSYERMITAQKGIDAEMQKASRWQSFGQGVENFVSAPLQTAGKWARGFLEALGPIGTVVTAGVTALAGFAAAGFAAAKSLAEYGLETKNTALRMGLTTKEVEQFSFAARMAGQDVSIFDRMMRGLSQAADETSKDGEKARGTLARIGVDLRSATGEMKPTSQVLLEISEGLAKLPAGFERDAAALGLFKRAGIEAVPVISGLTDNVKRAKELGLGATDEDLRRWEQYHANVAEAEVLWERFVRHIKEPLAATVMILFKDRGGKEYTTQELQARGVNFGQFAPRTAAGDAAAGRAAGFGNPQMEEWNRNIARDNLVDYTGRIEERKRADAAVLAFQAQGGAAAQLKKAEEALAAMTQPKVGVSSTKDVADYAAAEKHVETLKSQIEAAKKAQEDLNRFRTAATEFEKRGDESELDAIGKIYYQRDLLLKQAQGLKGVEAELAGIRRAADVQVGAIFDKGWEKYRADQLKEAEQTGEHMLGILPNLGKPTKEQVEMAAAQQRVAGIDLQARRGTIQREGNRALRVSELSGAPEGEAIRTAYQVRIELALELAAVEQERIDKELKGSDKLVAEAEAKRDVEKEAAEAMEQAQLKELEMLHKQSEEIKGTAAGLFHTLFTRPQDFGKQLGSTLKEAALKPVTEGLGTITANVLHPLIFGATGEGGVAGMFRGMFGGGRLNDVKLINGAMPVMVMNQGPGAGATGPGDEGGFSAAPWAGVGRLAMTGLLAGGLAMGAGMPAVRGGEVIGGGSSTAGLTQLSSGLYNRGAAGGGVSLPAVLGGGGYSSGSSTGGGAAGVMGMLKGFRGMNWGGLTRSAGSNVVGYGPDGTPHDDMGNPVTDNGDGSITGVNGAAGAALSAGGMMLAQRGLLGPSRGTWTGVAEGAAGGAMIGMQMGGPLGAAIGGVAGFGIGVGEKIAGVESPEVEAQKLVKQIYGIDIPQSNSVIKQIVQMAQSQYGGSVSMTVRTPAVRDLLQLYAESTGQKSNLFLSQPHGVNLTEANGVLNQSAIYNNGTPYTYASNLPVLGPAGGGQIPTGNPFAGGVTVQVSAEQTANLWATGTAAAIAGGSRAVAASAVNGQAASASRISGANVMLSPDVVAV
jgi:hypothetical protein